MKYYIVLLLAACMLATTASGCAKYGCPANTEANMAKPKKKGKVQHGLVPADYAKNAASPANRTNKSISLMVR
ncbi:MAG: hypothetical protein IPL33_00060 [Sphingobacteriales bacterium]|nr:hypothetical protein [Sphingobacteriales bacterium]